MIEPSEVAAAIEARVGSGRAPGVVGVATPRLTAGSGVAWTVAQIEMWRDTELAWLGWEGLRPSTSHAGASDRAARIALALADARVRDVTMILTARGGGTGPAADVLWPVMPALPARWAAGPGVVLAVCEWINGRDPRPILDLATPPLGYRAADQLRLLIERGASGPLIRQQLLTADVDQARYGATDRDAARRLEASDRSVLGAAMNRAGWAVQITHEDPETGQVVGYLLREHARVAVLDLSVDAVEVDGDVVRALVGHGAIDFVDGTEHCAAWQRFTEAGGLSDVDAVGALMEVHVLGQEMPRAAARLVTSPTVMARTDVLLNGGPTRGPRQM